MRTILFLFILLFSAAVMAQDTNYVDQSYKPEKAKSSRQKKDIGQRVYYGGTFGLSFGTYTSILVEPLIGYRITERWSSGIGLGVRYGRDNRAQYKNVEFTNYIGRVFSRYLLTDRFYAHIEFMEESYDDVFYFESAPEHKGRTLVPFLFVGGGFRSQAGRGSFIFQVLFNVMNDARSQEAYPSSFPYLSIGYIGGF